MICYIEYSLHKEQNMNKETAANIAKSLEKLSAERQELVERIANLENFMHSHAFADLTPTSQGLLMVQLEAMRMYADTLDRRIEIN